MDGVKPKQLAKEFKVDAARVHQMVQRFNLFIKEQVDSVPRTPHVLLEDNVQLLTLLKDYFLTHSLHHLSLVQLQQFLKSQLPPELKQVPSLPTIRSMLKKHFHLQYHKFKTANFKYRDPTFNEKRLWTS